MEDLHKNPFQSPVVPLTELLRDKESKRLEAQNFSLDKIRINPQEKNVNVEISERASDELIEKIQSSEVKGYCEDHPDEEFQFYSFTNDRALCSECILSGIYTGCEVLSLKKAADRIKPKFQDLLKELSTKADQVNLLQSKAGTKLSQANGSDSKVRNEIRAQFDKLRAAIDRKEREIFAKYNLSDPQPSPSDTDRSHTLKQLQEKILEVQDALNSKLKTIKDSDLCQYYQDKSKLIRTFLSEECVDKIKQYSRPASSNNLSEQLNPNEYKEAINKLVEAVNNLKEAKETKEIKETANDEFKSRMQSLQNRFTHVQEPEKEKSEILIENASIPGLLKLRSNISEEISDLPVRPRSVSPFRALKKELEIISPMSILAKEPSSPGTATDDHLRKLLDRVEDMKRGPLQTSKEVKKESRVPVISKLNLADLQTQSMARLNLFDIHGTNTQIRTHTHTKSNPKFQQTDNQKEKDSTKKYWENYKELIEEKNIKQPLTNSTTKLGEVERNKPVPKSFISDFAKPKLGAGAEGFVSPTKLFSAPTSKGLSSTKNLRSLIQDETRPSATWKMQTKREEERRTVSPNISKSFASNSSSLTSNLRKLKREMGLSDD